MSTRFGHTVEDEAKLVGRSADKLLASSAELGWRSISASIRVEAPFQAERLPPPTEHTLAYLMAGSLEVTRFSEGKRQVKVKTPRRFSLCAAGQEVGWAHDERPQFLHIMLGRAVVDDLVLDWRDRNPAHVELLPRFAATDPLIEQLALNIAQAVWERPPGHALYADCLAQAMAAQLLQRHSTLTPATRAPKTDGMTDYRLRRLSDFIEANLHEEIGLKDLAAQVGLSPLYLAHAFKRAFGQPPHRYLIGRRVERAKSLLVDGDMSVGEIAQACGFADQSHFSHAFKKHVGFSPGAYRRQA